MAKEQLWDAPSWCPALHRLAQTIFDKLDVSYDRKMLTRKEFERAGTQLFACPGADLFKGDAGNVSQMFVSYILMEPLLLNKALVAPHDMVRFPRADWHTILKGKTNDWDPHNPVKTEEYARLFGLEEMYDEARGACMEATRVTYEEDQLFLFDFGEDDSASTQADSTAMSMSSHSSSPAQSTAASNVFTAGDWVSNWYTRSLQAVGFEPDFLPVTPAGQLALRSEKSRIFLEPNGWRQTGPGNFTGLKDFKVYKQEKTHYEKNEFVFVFVGANGGKRTQVLSDAADVWESYDMGAVFLFDQFVHSDLAEASGEHIFNISVCLRADGNPNETVVPNVRIWHHHGSKEWYVLPLPRLYACLMYCLDFLSLTTHLVNAAVLRVSTSIPQVLLEGGGGHRA